MGFLVSASTLTQTQAVVQRVLQSQPLLSNTHEGSKFSFTSIESTSLRSTLTLVQSLKVNSEV